MKRIIALALLLALPACRTPSAGGNGGPKYCDEVYAWLCAAQQPSGFIAPEGRDFESVYANAVAAMAYTLKGDYDRAAKVFNFFQRLMSQEFTGPGVRQRGFLQFHLARGAPCMDSIRWEGDNSWLLLALTFYKEKTGTTNYDHMARAIADWLVDLQDRPGAELSEQNDYGLWYGFDFAGTNFVHTKCIEGNLDAWAALAPYPDKAEARAKLRDYILSKYHPDERRLQLGGDWEIIDSETVAWSCACGIAPDLLALDYATNHIVRVTSEITGLELEGFAFMPDDAKAGRLEIAPTIEIASAYQALGKPDEANRWMREIDKTVIESSVYPGTKGFAFVANKTRWPNDPADLRRISPHACSWYIFVCEGFNPFMIGR